MHAQGLENLKENDRAEFFKHFSVSAAEQNAFSKEHPAPADQPSPPPAKKQKVVSLFAYFEQHSNILVTLHECDLFAHQQRHCKLSEPLLSADPEIVRS